MLERGSIKSRLIPKCNCRKIFTFIPHQYMLEGGSIKSKLQKNFRGTKKAWDSFIRQGLKMATPLISAAVAAKTKNQLKKKYYIKIIDRW